MKIYKEIFFKINNKTLTSEETSTETILKQGQSKIEIISDEKPKEIFFQILYRRKKKEKNLNLLNMK